MKTMINILGTLTLALMLAAPAMAVDIPSEVTLFKNVKIFDGKSEKLLVGYDVLVVRNLIKEIKKNIPTEGTYELEVKTGRLEKIETLPSGCADAYTVIVTSEAAPRKSKLWPVEVLPEPMTPLMSPNTRLRR